MTLDDSDACDRSMLDDGVFQHMWSKTIVKDDFHHS